MTKSTSNSNQNPVPDLLLRVVGPILIMLMIGSLVFLLIEVFYRGPHDARIRWVFGLFTLATVLVSRIAIEAGLERAMLFGIGLGIATLITATRLVDFEYGAFAILEPFVLGLFILVVMWSANRLTWDCTLIDASRDVSSIGLLDVAKQRLSRKTEKKNAANSNDDVGGKDCATDPKSHYKFLSLLFAGSATRNTPGLWVLYFSLAAFPIFGFGQWFAHRDPEAGYFWIFWLFAVYLGSGLGLLMLTSLLGLDRYLRKRGAQMPVGVMRNWMVVGTLFALAIMIAVVILPRPNLTSSMERSLAWLVSPDLEASKLAVGNDGGQSGELARGEKFVEDNAAPASPKKPGNGSDPSGESSGSGTRTGGKTDSQASGKKGNQANGQKGDEKGQSKKDQASRSSNKGRPEKQESNNRPENKSKTGARKNDKSDQQDRSNKDVQNRPSPSDQNQGRADNKNAKRGNGKPQNRNAVPRKVDRNRNAVPRKVDREKQDQNNRKNSASSNPNSPRVSALSKLGKFLTYIFGAAILLVLIWMFRDELGEFWNQLFRKKESLGSDEKAEVAENAKQPLPGFGAFREPFSSGVSAGWTNAQTVEYTFAALEAWARDRQHFREEDQTPFEFATNLAGVNKAVSLEATRLADLHGRCLFGGGEVNKAETKRLVKLWNLMVSSSINPPAD